MSQALAAMEAEPAPSPEAVSASISIDQFRGALYSSYAQTAQATSRLVESEKVQRLAEQGQAAADTARQTLGNLVGSMAARHPSFSSRTGSGSSDHLASFA